MRPTCDGNNDITHGRKLTPWFTQQKTIPLQKINILKELAEYRHIRRVPIRQTTIHAPDAFSSALVDGLPALFRVGILVRDHGRVRDERP